MNREELAWAAGFFDGEGCTSLARHGPDGRYACLAVTITQAEPEVIARFHAAVGGIGRVYDYPSRPGQRYTYAARRFEHAQAVLAMLWPFLGVVKRAQALRALDGYWAAPHQSVTQRQEWVRIYGGWRAIHDRASLPARVRNC